jgi:hypothetical protein
MTEGRAGSRWLRGHQAVHLEELVGVRVNRERDRVPTRQFLRIFRNGQGDWCAEIADGEHNRVLVFDRLAWPRFFVFDAAGGIGLATLYGLGAYYLGREISHLAKPIGIGLGVLALTGVIGLAWFLHSHEIELEKKAAAALPGPLRPLHRKKC